MIYLFSILTIFAFLVGQQVSKKLRSNVLNPFLIALVIVVALLYFVDIPYQSYYQGNFPLNNLLGISVVALALPFMNSSRKSAKNGNLLSRYYFSVPLLQCLLVYSLP